MLKLGTRVTDANPFVDRIVGTVVGKDKNGKPIVCDDADGLCLTDYEGEFRALPTPREVAKMFRRSAGTSVSIMRDNMVRAFRYVARDIQANFRALKSNLKTDLTARREALELYYGKGRVAPQ